eukprot:scaffold46943_cov191-Amphora_coffeaeformis.AAC.2
MKKWGDCEQMQRHGGDETKSVVLAFDIDPSAIEPDNMINSPVSSFNFFLTRNRIVQSSDLIESSVLKKYHGL